MSILRGEEVVVVKERIDPGSVGERIAAEYLKLKGYRIIERNFRLGHLEIDLIAYDSGCLVFVEVKTRRNSAYGSALEAINFRKMSKIRLAARRYLSSGSMSRGFEEIRFDLVAIDLDYEEDSMVLRHLKGIS